MQDSLPLADRASTDTPWFARWRHLVLLKDFHSIDKWKQDDFWKKLGKVKRGDFIYLINQQNSHLHRTAHQRLKCCREMRFESPKYVIIRLRPIGSAPDPAGRAYRLQRSPDFLAEFFGGRGKLERKDEKKDGKGRGKNR